MKKVISVLLCMLIPVFTYSCSEKTQSKDTPKESEIDYNTLDSSWECDYLKIATNSNWNERDSIDGDTTSVIWDSNGASPIILILSYSPLFKKMTQSELINQYKNIKSSDNDILQRNYVIEDTFVKNGQAYIVLSSEPENGFKDVEFQAEHISGKISFLESREDVIMEMIESIVFYDIN